MTNLFLKAKHWQLFSLTFGIPFIFQIVMMVNIFSNIGDGNIPDPTYMFKYMTFFCIFIVLFMGVWFGWFWSVAIGLQAKMPEGVKMKVTKYKIFFFSPLIYILVLIFFMSTMTTNSVPNPAMFIVILPLHLFSMFCMFYNLYFVAKTFKTVELQRETRFSDFAGEFFMIWFYPIGIWIIQPKINKMMEDQIPNPNV